MAFSLDDLLEGIRASRSHFLKHVEGLKEEQWTWQPYPECKTITETLVHLLCNDRILIWGLETKKEPDWETAYAEPERDPARLLTLLNDSHAALCAYFETHYKDAPLDTEIFLFGEAMKLGKGVPHISSEDYYHAGQVAYIRMASDPAWDYYQTVYNLVIK